MKRKIWFLVLVLTCSSARAFAPDVLPMPTNLDAAQSRALLDARADGREVGWRLFTTTIDGRPRSVLLLGEIHVAYPSDVAAARKVIDQFEYIATENGPFSDDQSWTYRSLPLAALLLAPEQILILSLTKRQSASPMQFALKGKRVKHVSNAEQLHTPGLDEEADILTMGALSFTRVVSAGVFLTALARWAVVPSSVRRLSALVYSSAAFVGTYLVEGVLYNDMTKTALVRNRDVSMTRWVDQWVKTDASGAPLLVIVGRAHLANMSRFLTERYGFTEVPVDEAHLANAEALIAR